MKKISHIWSVICTNSSTDIEKNNISLFNLVEKYTLTVPKGEVEKIKDKNKLIIPFKQELVSRFFKKVENENIFFDLRIDIINPNNEVLEGKDIKRINFDKKFKNIRIKNRIDNIPTIGSGIYYLSLKIKELEEDNFEEVAKLPIEIVIDFEK